jgi:hypothetical protein
MKRFAVIILSMSLVAPLHAKVYKLYFLGGQSNMVGHGRVSELPDSLGGQVSGVMIYHGNPASDGVAEDGKGIWAELRPGHGNGFQSNGLANIYTNRFGVELTFARRLRQLDPQSSIAILKYARGATSIDSSASGNAGCWTPFFDSGEGPGKGINQYDHFLAALRSAISVQDIDADGDPDTLVPSGIIWMQGESDGYYTREAALRYLDNLTLLMKTIRAAFHRDDIPVVIGQISDSGQDEDEMVWDYGKIIQDAQAAYVKKDPHAALVTTTSSYGYSDSAHYDSAGYLDLGRRFAEALYTIYPPGR